MPVADALAATPRRQKADLPIPPRFVAAEWAAAYAGLSVPTFLKAIEQGRFPKPISFGRRLVWDIRALDAAMDKLSGLPTATLDALAEEFDPETAQLRAAIAKRKRRT